MVYYPREVFFTIQLHCHKIFIMPNVSLHSTVGSIIYAYKLLYTFIYSNRSLALLGPMMHDDDDDIN